MDGDTAPNGEKGVGVVGIKRAVLAASATPVGGAGESHSEREFDRERLLVLIFPAIVRTFPSGCAGNGDDDEETPFGFAIAIGGTGLEGAGSRGGGLDDGRTLRPVRDGLVPFVEVVLTVETNDDVDVDAERARAGVEPGPNPPTVATEGWLFECPGNCALRPNMDGAFGW